MEFYCMKHKDFHNWTALANFGKTYLGAQMELEGVHSLTHEIKKVVRFPLKMSRFFS